MVIIKGWVTVARTLEAVDVMFGQASEQARAAGKTEEDMEANGMAPFGTLGEAMSCTERLAGLTEDGSGFYLTETKAINLHVANNEADLLEIEASARFVVIHIERLPGEPWLKGCVLYGRPRDGVGGPVPQMSRLMANGIQPFTRLTEAKEARTAYVRSSKAIAALASFKIAAARVKIGLMTMSARDAR